jgi:two-component system response regulator TrcR
VLVAEGDEATRNLMQAALGADGLQVVVARDSNEALSALALERIDLIVGDTALRPIGGIELCVRLRSQMIDVPIVFVSNDADLSERIDALLAGGDAFLVQPVHGNELVARVRRILWRVEIASRENARVGDLSLDDARGMALDNGTPIELSITEYRLLRYLLVNRGQTVTRSQILQSIWGTERCSPKLVDVYVGYLRKKLPDSVNIRSVRSLGYVLEPASR